MYATGNQPVVPVQNVETAVARRSVTGRRIRRRGAVILKYVQSSNAKRMRDGSFYTTFKGRRWLAINHPHINSLIAEGFWEEHDAGLIVYCHYPQKGWKVSFYENPLRNDTPDMSEIAAALGGGGHRGAAGAWIGYCPFDGTECVLKDKED